MNDTEIIDWIEEQCKTSPSGVSFDKIPPCEGEPGGFRFLRRFRICNPGRTIREAVEIAKREIESNKP